MKKSEYKKLVEQAMKKAGVSQPVSTNMHKQIDANPNVQYLRKELSKQPLVPAANQKEFIQGLAIVNNPKAFKSLITKTGMFEKEEDVQNMVDVVSTGMQGFTKTLADASAALTVQYGDLLAGKVKNRKTNRVNEQADVDTSAEDKILSTVNAAQKNAGAWLAARMAGAVKDVFEPSEESSADETPMEDKLREAVRTRIKKLMRKS